MPKQAWILCTALDLLLRWRTWYNSPEVLENISRPDEETTTKFKLEYTTQV